MPVFHDTSNGHPGTSPGAPYDLAMLFSSPQGHLDVIKRHAPTGVVLYVVLVSGHGFLPIWGPCSILKGMR